MSGTGERLFFGVPLPEAVRQRLREAIGDSLGAAPEARATPPENWHLTVLFLGSTASPLPALRTCFGLGAWLRTCRTVIVLEFSTGGRSS